MHSQIKQKPNLHYKNPLNARSFTHFADMAKVKPVVRDLPAN